MFPSATRSVKQRPDSLPLATAFIWVRSAKTAGPMSNIVGPVGFLNVLDPATLAFADYRGNRQLISTGNLLANDRVALFLMDYKNRERLKILGHARVEDVRDDSALAVRLARGDRQAKVERIVIIDIVSYDWNCPKYITPRYSIEEVEELVGGLNGRIAELEAQLRSTRA